MNSPPKQDNWINRLIGDRQRYRLEKRLGSGGMGDVFIAMDTLLGQHVALKLIKDTLVQSVSLRKRFEREVAICAALKSDHIVNVTDYGVTSEGHPFYVMEYLRGQSLGQLLRQQQQLGAERTVGIITQVCEGLRFAHEGVTMWLNGATASQRIKVIHRDLKPDNIFLVPTALGELVKILDFGVAKIRNETVEYTNLTSMFVGTFHYAAPEQFEVEANLDERADIYSLGIILYEMLSGTDPFGLGLKAQQNIISGMSWVIAHSSKPPIPLRSQPSLSHVSPNLEAVVMRCLQKAPSDRFASVEQLNHALQAAVAVGLQGSSTTVQPPQNHSPQRFEEKTVTQTFHPSGKANSELTVTQISPESGSTAEKIFSPEQHSLLEIFREFVGPIAATVLQQVLSKASSSKELVENLALYIAQNQQTEFKKRANSLFRESVVQQPTVVVEPTPLNKLGLDTSFIKECERDLLDLIGPIATFLIQNILHKNPQISAAELVNILAKEIIDSQKAKNFRQRLLK